MKKVVQGEKDLILKNAEISKKLQNLADQSKAEIGQMVSDLKQENSSLVEEAQRLNKQFKDLERKVVDDIDEAILELLSEEALPK